MDQEPDTSQPTSSDRETKYNEFVGLLARHDQSIRRFVRSLMPSKEGVDDVVQETALECWKKFDDFAPSDPDDAMNEFIRWACVIARYKAMSWQRDKSRDRLVFRETVIERLSESAIDQLDRQEHERKALDRCLGKLDSDQRRLILSVHSSGDSITAIAAETGEKARRLYSRVNGLRKLLLDCVQNRLASEVEYG